MRNLVFFLTIGLIIFSNPVDADVYSWTDEDGVKRFSNKPPVGDIKNLRTVKEIPYDEEAAALRKSIEKEQEEKRLAEKQKEYLEDMQNYYMQDRKLLERRLLAAESQLKGLEQEIERMEDTDKSSSSYYPYWPARPCWPKCGDKPGRPRPPGLKPPQVRSPEYPVPYQMSAKRYSKSSQRRRDLDQRSHKTSRPVKAAPIASPVIR